MLGNAGQHGFEVGRGVGVYSSALCFGTRSSHPITTERKGVATGFVWSDSGHHTPDRKKPLGSLLQRSRGVSRTPLDLARRGPRFGSAFPARPFPVGLDGTDDEGRHIDGQTSEPVEFRQINDAQSCERCDQSAFHAKLCLLFWLLTTRSVGYPHHRVVGPDSL